MNKLITLLVCLFVVFCLGVWVGEVRSNNDNFQSAFSDGYDCGLADGRLEGMKLRFECGKRKV
jgi:hypothetical protein